MSLSNNKRFSFGTWVEIVLGFAGAAIIILCCNNLPFGHYVDDIKWVLLAETFLRGSVQSPWSAVSLPNTNITWGFAFLLMPVVSLFGRQAIILKIFSALCVIVGSGFFYLSIRPLLERAGRILFLVGWATTAYLAAFSGNVISEAGYILFFGFFTYLLSRFKDFDVRTGFLLGTVGGGLCLIRSIGIVAPMSLVTDRRRFGWNLSTLLFVVGFLLVVVPISLLIRRLSGTLSFYGPYWLLGSEGHGLAGLDRFMGNILYYWKGLTCLTLIHLPAILPPIPWIKVLCMSIGGLVVGLGFWNWWRHSLGKFLELYFLGYMIVLGLWTYQAPRYALPLFPIFLALLGSGLQGVWKRRWGKVLLASFVAGIVSTNGLELKNLIQKSLTQDPLLSHTSEQWLADHSRPDEIVVSMDIARIYFFTGRRGLSFVPSSDSVSFVEGARKLGATIFFFKDNDYVSAAPGVTDPIVQQHHQFRDFLFNSPAFDIVYTNTAEGTTIFRFRNSGPVL